MLPGKKQINLNKGLKRNNYKRIKKIWLENYKYLSCAIFLNSKFYFMTIYVGNVPYSMTEDDLQKVFAEFGNVSSAKIIADKYSGRSKGFGFVDMDDEGEGQAAIEALNGKDFSGRQLKVNKAYPRKDNADSRE